MSGTCYPFCQYLYNLQTFCFWSSELSPKSPTSRRISHAWLVNEISVIGHIMINSPKYESNLSSRGGFVTFCGLLRGPITVTFRQSSVLRWVSKISKDLNLKQRLCSFFSCSHLATVKCGFVFHGFCGV